MKSLDKQCTETLKSAYRPGTQRNYRSRANIYIRFCQIYQIPPFPATEWNLIRYARYIGNGVTSFDTVKAYLSAVKRFHELARIPFVQNVHLLKLEMMALRRELVAPVRKAVPMTVKLLMDIYRQIDLDKAIDIVCYVALLVGFCLFLRRSNLAPDTGVGFNPKEQLTRGDVWAMGKLTMVDVKWSKNNQYKERELILPLIPARNKIICPVFWITYMINKYPAKQKSAPLFCYPKSGKMIPLTTEVLAKKYKDWVQKTGRDNTDYTLHGLRRGGTNHALTVGLCSEDIRLMGDWVSLSYLQYIDLTMERRVTNIVRFIDEMDKVVDEADQWVDVQENWKI